MTMFTSCTEFLARLAKLRQTSLQCSFSMVFYVTLTFGRQMFQKMHHLSSLQIKVMTSGSETIVEPNSLSQMWIWVLQKKSTGTFTRKTLVRKICPRSLTSSWTRQAKRSSPTLAILKALLKCSLVHPLTQSTLMKKLICLWPLVLSPLSIIFKCLHFVLFRKIGVRLSISLSN